MTIRVARWWVLLTIITTLLVRASGGPPDEAGAAWWWAETVVNRLSLILPFVLFAGGLEAAQRGYTLGSAFRRSLPLVLAAYLLGAFAAPEARLSRSESEGRAVSTYFPTGALTPINLIRLREQVEALEPDAYSFSVREPLRHPPNWLTYLAHQPAATSVFGLVNLLLGAAIGRLTAGLNPSHRRRRRWAVGLAGAVLFFIPMIVASGWVRASPQNSGLLGAWLPLLVPGLAAGVAYLRVWSRARLHSTSTASV